MHTRSALPVIRPVRALLLVAAVLAAMLGLTMQSAGVAHAAVADRWGFAFLDNPAPPSGYVPDPSRQWGSWPSPSVNQVTVDQTGLGSYAVHFPQIGGPGGVAHVTAVNAGGDWCQLAGWQPNGVNEDVDVACYDPNGNPVNSQFTVLYTSSSGTATPGGYGYYYSDISGAALAQYNSTGATNTAGKSGTGVWKVFLPNLGAATPVGNLQVTAVNPKQAARCKVGSWSPAATGQTVIVDCYNAANVAFDTQWTLSYSVQRSVYGPSFPPKSFGYLWYNGSVPAGTSFNSAGATNSLTTAGAGFVVGLPGIANTPDHAQATAYGSGPAYCDLTQPWDRTGGNASVYVTCYNPGGQAAPGPFFAAYSSAF